MGAPRPSCKTWPKIRTCAIRFRSNALALQCQGLHVCSLSTFPNTLPCLQPFSKFQLLSFTVIAASLTIVQTLLFQEILPFHARQMHALLIAFQELQMLYFAILIAANSVIHIISGRSRATNAVIVLVAFENPQMLSFAARVGPGHHRTMRPGPTGQTQPWPNLLKKLLIRHPEHKHTSAAKNLRLCHPARPHHVRELHRHPKPILTPTPLRTPRYVLTVLRT